MRSACLALLLMLAGCAPAIDAEITLIEQSRRGIAMVKQSIESRRGSFDASYESSRQRLDDAFDADASDQARIDPQWLAEARKAYAKALDLLANQKQQNHRAIEADLDNLVAVDDALVELSKLNRSQRSMVPNVLEVPK